MNKIKFYHEHTDSYYGQNNYTLYVYEDDIETPKGLNEKNVLGMVEYVIYENEITVSDILVKKDRRREGFGSMLIKKMKSLHPDSEYKPSLKTDLGSKFIHKDIEIEEETNKIKNLINRL
jgi:hypothetical protein